MEQDYDEMVGFGRDGHYCKHGTYVGGWAGPDYLCGACEMGADTLVSVTEYRCSIRGDSNGKPIRWDGRWFADKAEAQADADAWSSLPLAEGVTMEATVVKRDRSVWVTADEAAEMGDN